MAENIFEKYAGEVKYRYADFSLVLATGESISTKDVSAVDNAGEDATSDIIKSSAIEGSDQVLIFFQAGTVALSNYRIQVDVVTSAGAEHTLYIYMRIIDPETEV